MKTQIDWISSIANKQIDDHYQTNVELINLRFQVHMQGCVILALVVSQVALLYEVYGN